MQDPGRRGRCGTTDVDTDSSSVAADRSEGSGWWWPRSSATLCLLAAAPFVIGIAALLVDVGGGYHPDGDIAQIEMLVRDVGRYQVLLGPYSRDGWHHPGPSMLYLLAAPYRLLGQASIGLHIGGLAINAASVIGMALLARRRGGTPLMVITLVCCGLLVRSLGPEFVRSPWNPSLTVLPFGVMLFLTWTMMCGDSWSLPLAAGVASFLVQTHIGYAPLALPLLLAGVVSLVVARLATRKSLPAGAADVARQRDRFTRDAAIAAGVLAVLWLPAVLDQVWNEPGNLQRVIDYFRHPDEPAHSLGDGLRVMSAPFRLLPEWIVGRDTPTISSEPSVLYEGAQAPILLAVMIVAGAVLWRRAGTDGRRFVVTVSLAFALGVIAVTRTTGLAFAYRLVWVHVLGMATGILLAWAAWILVEPSVTSIRRRTAGRYVAAAGVLLVAAVNSISLATAGTPDGERSDAIGTLTDDVIAALPPGDGPVLVNATSFGALLRSSGLVLGLERHGVPSRVPPISAAIGEHRLFRGEPLRATIVVAVDDDIPRLEADPSYSPLAVWTSDDASQRAPDELTAEFERAFQTGDIETMRRLARQDTADDRSHEQPFTTSTVAVFRQLEP